MTKKNYIEKTFYIETHLRIKAKQKNALKTHAHTQPDVYMYIVIAE